MKLREFNMDNSKVVTPKEPALRVSRSAGLITFNREAADALGVLTGGKIIFLQDEESPEDWFIKKSDSQEAFELRPGKNQTSMDLNSTHIARRILASVKNGKQFAGATFCIQKNPVEIEKEKLYLIITAKPINISEIKEEDK